MDPEIIRTISIAVLPVLLAITLHEVAHGWVALKFGDRTAQMLGRLSLNPLKHIDPIGTVLVPLVLIMLGGFVFGWAKPVPVTLQNLHNPKQDMAWVALAGPAANIIMAIGWLLLLKALLGLNMPLEHKQLLQEMAQFGVIINIVLAALNLLPIPPLDGGRILTAILPNKLSWQLSKIEPYGFFILVFLLATGALAQILRPMVNVILGIITGIF